MNVVLMSTIILDERKFHSDYELSINLLNVEFLNILLHRVNTIIYCSKPISSWIFFYIDIDFYLFLLINTSLNKFLSYCCVPYVKQFLKITFESCFKKVIIFFDMLYCWFKTVFLSLIFLQKLIYFLHNWCCPLATGNKYSLLFTLLYWLTHTKLLQL